MSVKTFETGYYGTTHGRDMYGIYIYNHEFDHDSFRRLTQGLKFELELMPGYTRIVTAIGPETEAKAALKGLARALAWECENGRRCPMHARDERLSEIERGNER